jgi:hypothetical protein
MNFFQIALLVFILLSGLRIHREPVLRRARSRCNSR